MDYDSLQSRKVEDFEENRKSKTDTELLEKSFGLVTDKHEVQNYWKRFTEMKERKAKERMIQRRFEQLRRMISKSPNLSVCHTSDFRVSSFSMKFSEFDVNVGNTSWRSNPLMKSSKQAKQERERLREKKESIRMQNEKCLLWRKFSRKLFSQHQQRNSASALQNSTVTGNNCGMDPLLQKLNDINLQEFPDAQQDITDCEMS